MKQRLLRYWTYIRRGHSIYLVFLVSMTNFIVIQYRLLIEHVGILKQLFPHIWIFTVITIPTYLLVAMLIGYWDYKKGAFPIDSTIMSKQNPFINDLAKSLIFFYEGKTEEAKKILEKWK